MGHQNLETDFSINQRSLIKQLILKFWNSDHIHHMRKCTPRIGLNPLGHIRNIVIEYSLGIIFQAAVKYMY